MLHDDLLNNLESRVRQAHKGARIQRNIEYGICPERRYPIGEIDLLRYSKQRLVMYEVKGNHSNVGYRKAKEQYKRFKRYLSPLEVVGVYVTPERIKRLK